MNRRMPLYIAERIEAMLAQKGKAINKAKIILAGVAYKRTLMMFGNPQLLSCLNI